MNAVTYSRTLEKIDAESPLVVGTLYMNMYRNMYSVQCRWLLTSKHALSLWVHNAIYMTVHACIHV